MRKRRGLRLIWLDKISAGRVAKAEGLAAGAEGQAVRARGVDQKGKGRAERARGAGHPS